MTTNTCARRGIYIENPLPDKPRAKESKDCNPLIPAIQSTGSNMPLWKAIAFAGGLVLGLYSAPLHVASSCAASSQGSGTHHCSPGAHPHRQRERGLAIEAGKAGGSKRSSTSPRLSRIRLGSRYR